MNIGIDIGGSHIGIGIINKGQIEQKIEKDLKQTEKGQENILNLIHSMIKNIISQDKFKNEQIEIIGIACPGIVENGTIRKANNLNIEHINLKEEIQKIYPNAKIIIRNDAKCAALAEKNYGVLKNYENAIMLTIGTGIGGAVFYKNELLQSKKSEGYELGHMIIEKNGKACSCGSRGCFEAYASMGNLKKEIISEMIITHEINGAEFVEILKSKDEKIEKILEKYIENLSIGIANLVNIFEPEVIALGGSIVFYKDSILNKLIEKLKKEEYIFNKNAIPEIIMAELNNDAGMIGATIL